MFTVAIAEAPASMAWWKAPVAWIKASSEDGNSMVLAYMKDGSVCGEDGHPIGTNADEDYIALREAAKLAIGI